MIKNFTKRLGRSSVLALVALATIVTTGTGCDEIFGSGSSTAPSPVTPTESVYWTDGYEFVILDFYY